MKLLLGLFSLLITFSSCKSTTEVTENSKAMPDQLSGTYYISELEDSNVTSYKLVITFDKALNKVNGVAGCNRFFGNYTTNNNTITFEDMATSKKLCPEDIMAVERQFLEILNQVNTFSIEGNIVSFLNNDTVLFKAASSSSTIKKNTVINDGYKTAVKYLTTSRGWYNFILISKDKILVSEDRHLKNIQTYDIDAADWNALHKLIDAVNLEGLSEVTTPSSNHQHDEALHATLTLQIGDIEYISPGFDHGNPPKEIETLVNKVLSVKEKTVKQ